MTIDTIAGAAGSAQNTPPQNQTQSTNTTDGTSASSAAASNPKLSSAAAVAAANQQLDVAIVQSAVTLTTQNDPLALVYKTAIANLNAQLQPTLGDNAIQNSMSQDNSPEGTAGRIVSLSTGLFDLYKKSFPGEDESTVLDRFVKVIQGGVDEGFSEARGVLQGMGALNTQVGDSTIGGNIDKTYSLVTQGLADFVASTKAKIAAEAAVTGQADGSTASGSTDTTTNAAS